jgi:hypothetical protein
VNHNTNISTIQKIAPMTFNELRDKLFSNYEYGFISDADLVQIIEQYYLDILTIICIFAIKNDYDRNIQNYKPKRKSLYWSK